MMTVAAAPHRLAFLDALRGIAACYVILFHLFFVGHAPAPGWLGSTILVGGSGVTLFFLISAFSLCLTGDTADRSWRDSTRFWLRRYFRIAPLYYIALLYTVVTTWHPFVRPSAGAIVANVLLVFGMIPGLHGSLIMGGWSIGVEMLFYAVFPLLLWRARRPFALPMLCLGAILFAYWSWAVFDRLELPEPVHGDFYRLSIISKLQVFMLGMTAYRIYLRAIHGRALPPDLGRTMVLGALVLFYAWISGKLDFLFVAPGGSGTPVVPYSGNSDMIWQSLIGMLLILGLAIHPSRIFVNPVTLFFGRISYSLYLLHPPLLTLLQPVFATITAWHLPPVIGLTLSLGVAFLMLSPLAWLSFTLIERPGMRLGARVITRLA